MGDSVVNTTVKVQYELVRRRRRTTIALRVTDDAKVVVSAPMRTSKQIIDRFVASKADWIATKLDSVASLPGRLADHAFVDGDRFVVLGEEVVLCIRRKDGDEPNCTLVDRKLVVTVSSKAGANAIKRAVMQWYSAFGLQTYIPLVEMWVERLQINRQSIASISMAAYPKRMGSCSQHGDLKFALRSLLLPFPVVAYLALHEVAHLVHFDHSGDFKRLLALHMPDWKERQKEMSRLRLSSSRI